MRYGEPEREKLEWVGTSLDDLREFPDEVVRNVGFSLSAAQSGDTPHNARVLKGFSAAGVLEIRADFQTDTYRAVYAVKFAEAIYVLHCFQKKSKIGIATPPLDEKMIDARLKEAQLYHQRALEQKKERLK